LSKTSNNYILGNKTKLLLAVKGMIAFVFPNGLQANTLPAGGAK
jgi:hypothetical protein